MFAALGLGLALPYLAGQLGARGGRAAAAPGRVDGHLPQASWPFPMFATVVWLVWVLGQQSGIDGAGALLALLVAWRMVVWALTLRAAPAAVATVSDSCWRSCWLGWRPIASSTQSRQATPVQPNRRLAALGTGPRGPDAGQGQPVFVDFTAAWCVTCQYNKKTTLANAEVLADLAAKNVALLRADWTRRDPAITAALAQLGRNGVPVYVFYKPGSRRGAVRSAGVDEVRAAIAKL
jgi:thiol:disulfide interchange protein